MLGNACGSSCILKKEGEWGRGREGKSEKERQGERKMRSIWRTYPLSLKKGNLYECQEKSFKSLRGSVM